MVRHLHQSAQARAKREVALPDWLLGPGLFVLAAALLVFWRFRDPYGLDMEIYLQAGSAFREGHPVYDLTYSSYDLPFTYPPITLLVFGPMSLLAQDLAMALLIVSSMIATAVACWLVLRRLGYHRSWGLVGLTAAATGLMICLEPYFNDFSLGQINIWLMLLVVADFTWLADRRWQGVLVGAAAAAKLVPGLFIVYLLLTGRLRAAAVAAGTFLALTLAGFAVMPAQAARFWLDGLFFDSERVTRNPLYVANQSLHGLVLRAAGAGTAADRVWLPVALVVLVGGVALAVLAYRCGEDLVGMATIAVTGLLCSPVAWSHHWVWIGPVLVVMSDLIRRTAGRLVLAAFPIALALLFAAWPMRTGQDNKFSLRGVIWRSPFAEGRADRVHGMKAVYGEAYTLAGATLLLLVWAWILLARPQGAAEDGPA